MSVLRNILAISNLLKNVSPQQCLVYTSFSVRGRFKSTYESKEYTSDPSVKFLHPDVQAALTTLTRIDYTRVFRKRKLGDSKLEIPKYQFMTTDELRQATDVAHKTAAELLQMPPVLKIREPIDKILSVDPALQAYDNNNSRFIFTDISFGTRDQSRLIVSREIDGTLQYADWATRERINQIYFPILGREIHVPLAFTDEYLYPLLDRGRHEYILDRACAQFEPDSGGYQRASSITWQHADRCRAYEKLRSTRHFGPFVFFLSWFESIDNLLLELIETSFISEACALINLNSIVHNVTFDDAAVAKDEIQLIERYIDNISTKRAPLQLAMRAYKDLEAQRIEMERGIKSAHGR